jgi:hypothetical protein
VRYAISIPIEVSGIDKKRDPFYELTHTNDVSSWGCSFLLSIALQPNDLFSLRVMTKSPGTHQRRSLFQVLRSKRQPQGWLVAAWKLEDRNLWDHEIEQATPLPDQRQCRRAKTRKTKHGRNAADQ